MAIVKLSKVERRRLILFAICLLFAFCSWMFFALSNKYTYSVYTKIHYTDLPENKAFYPLQPDTLKLLLEGTGWQLLFSKFKLGVPYISISLESLKRRNFISVSNQLPEINRQLKSDQYVVSASPNTLYFDFSARKVKKVPVVLAYSLKFKKQYNISGDIQPTPEFVTISGPAETLNKIKSWSTDSLKLNQVDQTISRSVGLKSSPESNVSVYPNVVQVTVPVDEFTEKTVEVPIKVLNNNRYEVKLLPPKATITFMVSLSSYAKAEKDLFEAVADLKDWKEKGYTQLPVRLAYFPEYCKIVRVEPQTVDFILK